MKKVILLFLLFISVTTYGQKFRETKRVSPDGTLVAISYDQRKTNNVSHIELIKNGEVIKRFDPLKLTGENHGGFIPIFSGDSKKLYFGPNLAVYEYDIENDTFRRIFEDFEKPLAPKIMGVSGDTLLLRTTVLYHGDYWLGNEFYKHIDDNYIQYEPKAYIDYINGHIRYVNGRIATRKEYEEFVTLMK